MITFIQVETKHSIYKRNYGKTLFIFFCLIFMPLIIIIYFEHEYAFPLMAVILLPMILLWRKIFKSEFPKVKSTGFVSFKDGALSFFLNAEKTEIPYNEITYLKLNSNYIKNHTFERRDHLCNGLNKISFKTKDKSYQFTFVIGTEKEWIELKQILKKFYLLKIKVKEFLFQDEHKMILLDPDRSYEDIQRLKRQLGVDDFYKS